MSDRSMVLISVGSVRLAIPAELVDSVATVGMTTPLPNAPPHLTGLVALGERAMPLIDLGLLLAIPAPATAPDPMFQRTLFVSGGELEAGLVCSRAHGLTEIEESSLAEPALLQGSRIRPFLQAEVEIDGQVVGVLDVPALLRAAAVS